MVLANVNPKKNPARTEKRRNDTNGIGGMIKK